MGAADKSSSKSKRSRPSGAPADDARLPKRRRSPEDEETQGQPSKPKAGPAPKPLPLSTFHEAALADLRPKYDVLVASVISSTKIRARVERVVAHLRRGTKAQDAGSGGGGAGGDDAAPPLVLLHARPAEVCKMITVAETAKAALAAGGGGAVYQYNHLFELPPRPAEPTSVDETALGGGAGGGGGGGGDGGGAENEESDDGFEKLEIFDRAANPKGEARPVRSMGIFLSRVPVPELKSRAGVTVQTTGLSADGG